MFQGVDVAFYRAVAVGKFTPFFVSLPITIHLAEFAFFWHDDAGDFKFQELAVFDAAKASVEADAG